MRFAFALPLLAVACPALAQTGASTSNIPDRQSARSAYGNRLTAPDEDDDPTDRRVVRRLNTRINNRLETRIEQYRFVDVTGRSRKASRNPYAAPASAPEDR
jgi:hypothetical protein